MNSQKSLENHVYLKLLWIVLLFSLVSGFIYLKANEMMIADIRSGDDSQNLLASNIISGISIAGIIVHWTLLGFAFKKWPAAMIAICTHLVAIFSVSLIFSGSEPTVESFKVKRYILSTISFLPYLAFGLYALRKHTQWYFILIVPLFYFLNSNSFYAGSSLDKYKSVAEFCYMFANDGNGSSSFIRELPWNTIGIFIWQLSSVVLFYIAATLIHNIIKGTSSWNPLKLNLSYYHTKFQYSVFYWIFFLTILGIGVNNYHGISDINSDSSVFIITTIGYVIFGGWLALFYTSNLASIYLINRKVIGINFIFSNLPFVNILSWIINLFSFRRLNTLDEVNSRVEKEIGTSKGLEKTLLIIAMFVVGVYILNRAGLRLDGVSRDGADIMMLTYIGFFCMFIGYLYNKPLASIFLGIIIVSHVITLLNFQELTNYRNKSGTNYLTYFVFFAVFHLSAFAVGEKQTKKIIGTSDSNLGEEE